MCPDLQDREGRATRLVHQLGEPAEDGGLTRRGLEPWIAFGDVRLAAHAQQLHLRERGAAHSSSALPQVIIAPSRPKYRGLATAGQGAEIAQRHNEINGFRADLDSRVL